ncbi:MAG: F0F1 ATP synthase subunit epsilon [Chlorobiaceae bacterium]|nr:F0F1 ATP synthase subunit epsilon [Chlorobiaceae bacterium]NTV26269.1 F0F1 ATP synthase subunit epsilon [Chlorobiaceae bacterium]
MHLRVLLPFRVFRDRQDVVRLVVETTRGSYGLLPNRLDCVLPLEPGILMYQESTSQPVYIAIDQGILVKTGASVVISVRNAIGETDLGHLQHAVEQEFLKLDERERDLRDSLAKLESGFIRRYMELRHDQA